METMNCKGCGDDKPIAQMFVRGGRPIRTCLPCKSMQMSGNGKHQKLAAMANKVSKPAKAKVAAAAPAPSLAIEPGYGLDAAIDEGYLKLIQRDADGVADTMMISRAELRQVIQTFGGWAA